MHTSVIAQKSRLIHAGKGFSLIAGNVGPKIETFRRPAEVN
jgi:hypothetical protein